MPCCCSERSASPRSSPTYFSRSLQRLKRTEGTYYFARDSRACSTMACVLPRQWPERGSGLHEAVLSAHGFHTPGKGSPGRSGGCREIRAHLRSAVSCATHVCCGANRRRIAMEPTRCLRKRSDGLNATDAGDSPTLWGI